MGDVAGSAALAGNLGSSISWKASTGSFCPSVCQRGKGGAGGGEEYFSCIFSRHLPSFLESKGCDWHMEGILRCGLT